MPKLRWHHFAIYGDAGAAERTRSRKPGRERLSAGVQILSAWCSNAAHLLSASVSHLEYANDTLLRENVSPSYAFLPEEGRGMVLFLLFDHGSQLWFSARAFAVPHLD